MPDMNLHHLDGLDPQSRRPESERWSKREAMQQVQIQIVVLLPWYSPYPYKNVAQC